MGAPGCDDAPLITVPNGKSSNANFVLKRMQELIGDTGEIFDKMVQHAAETVRPIIEQERYAEYIGPDTLAPRSRL